MSEVCGIILAAGEGKRMKSNLPKVLSRVLDKPMLKWVIDAARGAGIEALCVVDGFKKWSAISPPFRKPMKPLFRRSGRAPPTR